MKIVSTSYVNTVEFNDPLLWLERISFYTGLLEELALQYQVESIEQINYSGELQVNGVRYHFLNFKKPKLYVATQLHRFIHELKPDIIFLNGLVFPLQVIQLRMKLGSKVKIIVLHRGEKPGQGIRKIFQKLADKCINAYLFASAELGKEWVGTGIVQNANKIHEVIQVSSVFLPQERNNAKKQLQITATPAYLWVGRFDKNKDPLTVVHAFLEYVKTEPAAKLYMIYQSNELLQEIMDVTEKNKETAGAIILVGNIPHQQLQIWYNAMDFIISGSHHEASGIAVCEAMSCGCIPLLTDIPSFRQLTGKGKCGLLYEPGNAVSLLKILLQTAELDIDKERAKTLQQFKTELSFEAIAKKIEQIIVSLKH